MNSIFKLIVFSLALNFSVGILLAAIPAFDTTGNGTASEYTGGLTYHANYSDPFTTQMNESVTPGGDVEDAGNQIYRVLDMLNIGFISRFISVIDQYMFGFIQMLEAMFGGYLGAGLSVMIFGAFRVIVTIGYLLGAWSLWTGRDLRT